MTDEQYQDEPLATIEWTLRIARLYNDRPHDHRRRNDDGDGRPRTIGGGR
ncbi:MAG: hypothetical protein ACTHMS_13245 [Jatrophihabitans sp.]